MPRRQSGGVLVPWLSAKLDNKEGRFLQVGNSLLLSREFQALSAGARLLYICVAMEAGGKREAKFPHRAAKKYGFASTSFERYIGELTRCGFLEKVETEERLQFAPNVYRFSFAWKAKSAPQNGDI